MHLGIHRNVDMEKLLVAEKGKISKALSGKSITYASPMLAGRMPSFQGAECERMAPKSKAEKSTKQKAVTKKPKSPSKVPPRVNSIFAQSILEKVIHSWDLIARNKDAVGLDFFSRVLSDNPDLCHLFSFGAQLEGISRKELKKSKFLQGHASAVMEFMGRGIRGLDNIDALIPDLRALGKTHVKAGVMTNHYDMFYRHLMAAFAEELRDKWDQETATAWANVFNGMKTVMDQPETMNQTEPMEGWGFGVAIASLFIAFASPARLAGFLELLPGFVTKLLDCLECMSACFLVGDMFSPWIVRQLNASPKRHTKEKTSFLRAKLERMVFPFKFLLFRSLYSLHLEQWMAWPRLDAVVLLSYLFQNASRWLNGIFSLYAIGIGVSWLHLFGLVRIAAMTRVTYFARCAENGAILKYTASEQWRRALTISNLLFTLAYVNHVSACLWCIVARVEIGATELEEAISTDFFPETELLLGRSSGALTAYIKAVYWAWVNLAGTGNVESVPQKPLEIVATLLVHICGATLYAISTGHVVSLLDQYTQKENRVGNDLAELRAFMDECGMPSNDQDRIMHGYINQTIMSGREESSVPYLRDDVGQRLPSHFREDLEFHAHSVALKRRNNFLENCSSNFLFALATSMTGTMKLLPGDYLFKLGEEVRRRVCMVRKGSLEIIVGDESIATLERGHCLGLGWLLEATLPDDAKASFLDPCELSDWLQKDGTAGVSIRATSDCIVCFGLPSPLEVEALQRRFSGDFLALQEKRAAVIARARNVSLNVVHAVAAMRRKAQMNMKKKATS